jgi:penicillin amidase
MHNELSDFLRELETTQFAAGSNSWVIHGNHTKSGYPLLSNDPHMGNAIPCNWYQVELLWEELN